MNMVNAYVGKPYKLVFPLLCNGYLNINYDDTVTVGSDGSSTTAISRLKPLWAHDGSFTLEAIITPYDVNGVASRTAGKDGILDSQKTPPYPDATNEGQASRFNNYESVNYLGYLNQHLTQKMMIFHNTNLKLYLQNTTSSSYNQPAEYKVVAEITSGGVTKTIQTDTVIKATNRLIGYYDSSAYYDGHSTSYRRLSTSASGSNPQGSVTVSGYSNLPVNVRATGEVAFSGVPAHYSSPVKATSTITIAGQANFKTDVFPAGSTSGHIKFGVVPDSATDSDTTEFIQITSEDGGEVTKWFAVDGATNGAELTGGSWPAGARAYTRSTDVSILVTNLANAINSYNNGWNGSASAGADPFDTSMGPPTNTVSLTGGIVGSAPNRKGADGDITLGSGLPNQITRVQIAGGTNELIQGETTGHTADSNINYITITDSAGNARNYFPSHDNTNQATASTGTRTLDDSSTVSVRYFRWASGGNNNDAAAALTSAINANSGHGSTITATRVNNVITLTHDLTGTAGNSATLAKTNTADSVATISGSNFTGGITETNNQNTPHIVIIDASGTTKNYVPVRNGDAISTGTSQTIGSVSGVAFQVGADATATGNNLDSAIEHANGHNGSIISVASSGTLTLTQSTVGTVGNKDITLNNTSNTTRTNFANGANPDSYISITDSQGTLKKYKASTVEVTGTTDGTYTFFRRETNNDTTTANLETAIDGANGHNGTIITTRASNVLTCKLNVPSIGSGAISLAGISSGASVSNFATTNNNDIEVSSAETDDIGKGSKIYDSSTKLIGTVLSISGTTITLDATPATNITSTIYTEHLKEAMYLEEMFKISLVLFKEGSVEIHVNNELVAKDSHTLGGVQLHASDCQIGRGANNNEQFFGELFEISMAKTNRPSPTLKTLQPGYSDILFYYTFED
jgi:hypothetical protein